MISPLPPALIFIIGALFIPLFRGTMKGIYALIIPIVSFVSMMSMSAGNHWNYSFLDLSITLFRYDNLSIFFGYIYHLIAIISIIFSQHVKNNTHYMAALIYSGSALGVVFAGDLISLFIFWEMMALAATMLVWDAKTKESYGAGFRYLLFHIIGGLFLLAGIAITIYETGSAEFNFIGLKGLGSWLIFIGFGINCAWPGLHAWIPDAYPNTTPAGGVFMWTFTTKTAIYTLARGFPGAEPLIWIGAIMTVFPIFFAVVENNLRKVLSYSLMNQLGYMVCGIGIGTTLSLNGAISHVFCHILYKALLVMSMGAVMYRTGKINCTDLGGLYKSMPMTAVFCIIGAMSISAFPLFNGFVSKAMVVDAAGQGAMVVVWFLLMFASVGVLEHAGIKVPFHAFFAHDSGIRTKEAPTHMLIAMGVTAFLCIFTGLFPSYLYALLPYPVEYEPYTAAHIVTTMQLLSFGALAYILLVKYGIFPAEMRATNLDIDWTYRKLGRLFVRFCEGPLTGFREAMARTSQRIVKAAIKFATDPLLVPELIVKGAYVGIYKALTSLEDQRRNERLHQLEAKLNYLRGLKETGRYYGTDMPKRPLGWGVLIAFALIFLYMIVYMFRVG